MPFDRSRYPKDWAAISARIREREGNRCKWCGLENGNLGKRDRFGVWHAWADVAALPRSELIRLFRQLPAAPSVIVLTVAHVYDRDPMNCDDDNLAALCQGCHLNHDRAQHMANAAETRRNRLRAAGQSEMRLDMP